MFRKCLFLFAAATLGAQESGSLFNQAPPEKEKALREAVAGFYQSMVEGKFRQAEKYVAEDTKDAYYNQEKQKIRGFEIVKIQWSDGFDKATAVTEIQTNLQIRGQDLPVVVPMATRWKLENGNWGYYVNTALGKPTPFGDMKAGPGKSESLKVEEMIKNPQILLSQLKISKQDFLLKSYEKSSDSITITNGMPGSITVSFETETIAGLTWKLEKTELNAGETGTLTVTYDPPNKSAKPALRSVLRIEPFAKAFLLPISFDIPEDVKKQIPKK